MNTRKIFYNAHIKLHIDYVSTVWDGCSEEHLKKYLTLHRRAGELILPDPSVSTEPSISAFQIIFNSLHRRAGKLILPNPSLSTEPNISAFRILNLHQQFTYNKELFMYKVINNNSIDNLARLFISHPPPFLFFLLLNVLRC